MRPSFASLRSHFIRPAAMFGGSKRSQARRLGVPDSPALQPPPPAAANTSAAPQAVPPHAAPLSAPAAARVAAPSVLRATPASWRAPPPSSSESKSQALAAFQCLVEGAAAQSRLLATPTAQAPAAAAAPEAAAGAAAGAAEPAAAAAAPRQQHSSAPPAASRAPHKLLPHAVEALQQLRQQLASRSLTYLYQFDAQLQRAHTACAALTAHLASGDGSASGGASDAAATLAALLPPSGSSDGVVRQQQAAAAPGGSSEAAAAELLKLCTLSWDVCALLLTHHRAAEPVNAAQQAAQFQHASQVAWEVCEAAHPDLLAPEAGGNAAQPWLPADSTLACLDALVQVASSWLAAGVPAAADWCHTALRRQLGPASTLSQLPGLGREQRLRLQRLEWGMLQGGLSMAARQGQQALWVNLTRMLKQLLGAMVMDEAEALSRCLALAGDLATQASSDSSAAGAVPAQPSEAGAAAPGANGAVLQLEFASELLQLCRQQADALAAPAAAAGDMAGGGSAAGRVVEQVADIQAQVLLQLGQAYLAAQQHAKALECASTLQALGRPLSGVVQLACQAQLGLDKPLQAAAQLSAWLRGGGQAAEEACSTVTAFLQALQQHLQGAAAAAGSAEALQQLVQAAAERCSADPAVAVAVLLHLLQGQGCHESSLQLVLVLLQQEEVLQHLLHHPAECGRVHALLHRHGQAAYECRALAAAVQLLTPAVFFAAAPAGGKSARLLAMALLKSGQQQRALEYVALAEQQDGGPSCISCLIRLQAILVMEPAVARHASAAAAGGKPLQSGGSDTAAVAAAAAASGRVLAAAAACLGAMPISEQAAAAIQQLCGCADRSSNTLQAAFGLCMQAGQPAAAWHLLVRWRAAAKDSISARAQQQQQQQQRELCTLALMHTLLNGLHQSPACTAVVRAERAAVGAVPAAQQGGSSRLGEMCSVYSSCVAALQPAATAAAAGAVNGSSSKAGQLSQEQLAWVAESGLQLGTAAAAAGLCDAAAGVLGGVAACCAQQQPATSQAAAERAHRHAAALCVAASLLLQAHLEQPQQRQLQAVQQLLDAAEAQLQLLPAPPASASADPAAAAAACGVELRCLACKLAFALACRRSDEGGMKQALHQLVALPGVAAADFQAAAQECLAAPASAAGGWWRRSQAVAALAYGYMLRLAAAAQPPDAAAAAAAVGGIMSLVGSHAVKLKVCDKVAQLLATQAQAQQQQQQQQQQGGAAAGGAAAAASASNGAAYPPQQLRWLLVSCWNAAVSLSLRDAAVAQQYLGMVAKLAHAQQQQQQQQQQGEAGAGAAAGGQPQQHWLLGSQRYAALKELLAERQAAIAAAAADTAGSSTGAGDVQAARPADAAEAAAGATTCDHEQAKEAHSDAAEMEPAPSQQQQGEPEQMQASQQQSCHSRDAAAPEAMLSAPEQQGGQPPPAPEAALEQAAAPPVAEEQHGAPADAAAAGAPLSQQQGQSYASVPDSAQAAGADDGQAAEASDDAAEQQPDAGAAEAAGAAAEQQAAPETAAEPDAVTAHPAGANVDAAATPPASPGNMAASDADGAEDCSSSQHSLHLLLTCMEDGD